jgi:hypothetical protein
MLQTVISFKGIPWYRTDCCSAHMYSILVLARRAPPLSAMRQRSILEGELLAGGKVYMCYGSTLLTPHEDTLHSGSKIFLWFVLQRWRSPNFQPTPLKKSGTPLIFRSWPKLYAHSLTTPLVNFHNGSGTLPRALRQSDLVGEEQDRQGD